MKKRKYTIIIILSILIGTVVIIGLKKYNKPHINVLKAKTDFILTSHELLNQFTENEDIANVKYANKIILTKGTIKNIQINKGKGIITLKGKESTIICELNKSENDKLSKLNKNQIITIKGICSGYLMDVLLMNCIIQKSND